MKPDATLRGIVKTIYSNLEKEGFTPQDFVKFVTIILGFVDDQLKNQVKVRSIQRKPGKGLKKIEKNLDKSLFRKWERRSAPRFNIQSSDDIQARGEKFYIKVIDISSHGLCCEVSKEHLPLFEVERQYNLSIEFMGEELDVVADVRWKSDNLIGLFVKESLDAIIERLKTAKASA